MIVTETSLLNRDEYGKITKPRTFLSFFTGTKYRFFVDMLHKRLFGSGCGFSGWFFRPQTAPIDLRSLGTTGYLYAYGSDEGKAARERLGGVCHNCSATGHVLRNCDRPYTNACNVFTSEFGEGLPKQVEERWSKVLKKMRDRGMRRSLLQSRVATSRVSDSRRRHRRQN